jgi:hypothetical protein
LREATETCSPSHRTDQKVRTTRRHIRSTNARGPREAATSWAVFEVVLHTNNNGQRYTFTSSFFIIRRSHTPLAYSSYKRSFNLTRGRRVPRSGSRRRASLGKGVDRFRFSWAKAQQSCCPPSGIPSGQAKDGGGQRSGYDALPLRSGTELGASFWASYVHARSEVRRSKSSQQVYRARLRIFIHSTRQLRVIIP